MRCLPALSSPSYYRVDLPDAPLSDEQTGDELLIDQDGAGDGAFVEGLEGLVDAVEREGLRDELVEAKPSLAVPID